MKFWQKRKRNRHHRGRGNWTWKWNNSSANATDSDALFYHLRAIGTCQGISQFARLCVPISFFPIGFQRRVGSANFSCRKIGHPHDNSADCENVAGENEPNVHAHSIFRFENSQGNNSFFLSMPKTQLKQVNHKLSRRTIDAPSTWQFCEASSSPEKSLVQHSLVEKKNPTNFVDRRKLLSRGY